MVECNTFEKGQKAGFVPLGRMCYTVLKDTVENEVQI